MTHVTAVIIGAGHSGLAMSRQLSEHGIDHVVLERGDVANSWRTERWDSLKLLTPNWQCRLPGSAYNGGDPDGFMASSELADFVTQYSESLEAPIHTATTVTSVTRTADRFRVVTDREPWTCEVLVAATGACNKASLPSVSQQLGAGVLSLHSFDYRNPDQLPPGGALVVGGSASGVQIADEIQRSGRPVTLAVGEHVRVPRTYRGRDIMWWLDHSGLHAERYDEIDDLVRGRNLPSPQLSGSREKNSIDLNRLSAQGIQLVGRAVQFEGHTARFSGGLANLCKLADLKQNRLLDSLDEWAGEAGVDDIDSPERFEPTQVPPPVLELDLHQRDIRSVVWATGYRPDYSWLDLPIVERGQLRHDGGVVTEVPGMYVLGLPLLRRRNSSFIHGASDDTADLSEHILGYLATA